MTEEDKFVDVTDDEIKTRLEKLIAEYENLVPILVKNFRKWSKLKRELKTLTEEAQNRGLE